MTRKTKNEFKELRRFEDQLTSCSECGICSSFCPIYAEERVESSLSRGKKVMIGALMRGELGFTNIFKERMNKCLLCKTCTEQCPSGTDVAALIVATRADIVRARGLPLSKRIVFTWLLKNRMLFGNMVKLASKFQWLLPKGESSIRHLPLFLSALGKGRQIPPIAKKFLRQEVPVVNRPPAGVPIKLRVGFFIGCATDFMFPHIGKALINFLTRNGVEVVVPKKQDCCGAPVYLGSGDFETGRKIAETNVNAFAGLDIVVTCCATCSSALKDYAKFLADTPERVESYSKFAAKIKDISEFVVDDLKLPASAYQSSAQAKGLKVTWHDPCHLNRYQGIISQPRQILRSIPDVEFVEMSNAGRCCGMAGTFSISYYELSKTIADQKIDAIKATRADAVVTGCPGCMMQFIDNLARHKMPQKVMHIMDLLG